MPGEARNREERNNHMLIKKRIARRKFCGTSRSDHLGQRVDKGRSDGGGGAPVGRDVRGRHGRSRRCPCAVAAPLTSEARSTSFVRVGSSSVARRARVGQ